MCGTLLMTSPLVILGESRWFENRSESPSEIRFPFQIWTRIPYQQSPPEERAQ